MSVKERRRLAWFTQVQQGSVSLAEAARQIGLSYRQALRLWKRYRARGDAGLVHGLRGRVGTRRGDPEFRSRVVALYAEHYRDFGATLACEYLLQAHGLTVDDQTLRRWLEAADLWRRRRGRVQRSRRARRECFGDLVQIDGSDHAWFEGRSDRCTLMVMVDDATSWTWAQFYAAETTEASLTMVGQWSRVHGLPRDLYPDRHSIYRVNTKAAEAAYTRTGKRPLTQFGRAMQELGVGVICAHSPQAKGRVERMNGTLQDRLVKALRVKGLGDMGTANAYLRETFLPELNERFAVAPSNEVDAHVAVNEEALASALCWREERVVGKDQCVCFEGAVLQLLPDRKAVSLAGKRVTVEQTLDGEIRIRRSGVVIRYKQLPTRPKPPATKPTLRERVSSHAPAWKPPSDHPWKRAAAVG